MLPSVLHRLKQRSESGLRPYRTLSNLLNIEAFATRIGGIVIKRPIGSTTSFLVIIAKADIEFQFKRESTGLDVPARLLPTT